MINDVGLDDLLSYRRIVLWASTALLSLLSIALIIFWQLQVTSFLLPLAGAWCGTFLASANVLTLAYAFYALVIKNLPKRVVFWPITSFVLMCACALFFALYQDQCLLGFALGLTTPLIFAAIIAYRA